MTTRWWLALGLALPLLAAPASPADPRAEDLVFQAGDHGLPLMELIEQAQSITGEPFFFDLKDVKDRSVWFAGKVTIPREKFLVFFDRCLHDNEFAHLERVEAGIRVHTLRKLGQQARGQQALKGEARVVSTNELAALADRWVLVTTTFAAQNLPARELVTTLQLYFADSSTESVRNVEGTNSIVMTGFSSNLAAIVDMARQLDRQQGESVEFVRMRDLEKRLATVEARLAALAPDAGKKPADK